MKLIIRIAVLLSVVSPALAAENTGQKIDPALYAQRKESVNTYLLNIYIAQKRKPEAMAQYKTLLAMKPTDPKLNGDLGKFEASSGQLVAAITHMRKACDLDPGNAQFWGTLGQVYIKNKQYDLALDAYKRAVNLGGADYQRPYDEALKYIEYMKRKDEFEKRNKKLEKFEKINGETILIAPKSKQDDDEW